MRDRPIKRHQRLEEKYEIVLDVAEGQASISFFGLVLEGKGQVWVETFSFEVGRCRRQDNRRYSRIRAHGAAITPQPAWQRKTVHNLDFEK